MRDPMLKNLSSSQSAHTCRRWTTSARRLLVGGFLFLSAVIATAESGSRDSGFFIETIVVEEAERFSTSIILAESLLEEEKEYTEQELREAVFRIVRLPLILDAEFSLRKGTERGKFELVIRVEEARRWFFGLDVRDTIWNRPISVAGTTTSNETTTSTVLAGRRFSIGRYGVFFAALGGSDGSLNLGYSQHNLLNRKILLSLSYAFAGCGGVRTDPTDEGDEGCRTELFDLGLDPTLATWSNTGSSHRLRLSLGIPVEGNKSIRLAASFRDTEFGLRRRAFEPNPSRFDLFEDRQELDLGASWVFDSVDDPLFPTTGKRWDAGISLRSLRADVTAIQVASPGATQRVRMKSLEYGLRFEGSRYLPVGRRHTVWGKARGFLGGANLNDVPSQDLRILDGSGLVWRAGLSGGYSRVLRQVRRTTKWREWRWESETEVFGTGTSPEFEQADNPLVGVRVGSGFSLRSKSGVFRFQLVFAVLEGL